MKTTRRDALRIISAAGVTCVFPFPSNELYGQHMHAEHAEQQAAKPAEPFVPQAFTAAQFLVISRLTDLIIPATDTPGASEAGVPEYVDLVVSGEPKLQMLFEEGLRHLDLSSQAKAAGTNFAQLREAQQVEILTAFSESKAEEEAGFFKALKNLTSDGYYTSRVGLLQELGYNGNTYLAAFPQFSIPEH